MLILFLSLLSIVFLLYKWSTYYYDFFDKRSIPYSKPFPLFGNMSDIIFHRSSMFDLVRKYYDRFDSKVFGMYDQRKPLIVIKDPALVRQITVKDFDHFINHRQIFGNGNDDDDHNLFAKSLFALQDSKWKDMRSTLSPAFTGSKMRQMFDLISNVAKETIIQLRNLTEVEKSVELDMKDYSTRFTSDIIASTAFGLNANSFKDENNEFYRMGKKLTNFSAAQNLKFFLTANFKTIMKLLKIEVFDIKYTAYFKNLVLDAIKYRLDNNITRPDMINMLMEARGLIKSENKSSREWTDNEMVAQCFLFFFAGFETASILMCFAAHELMENPDTQDKLYAEVKEVAGRLNGEPISYELLQAMKYMDMVISETLRKWPPAVAMDRVCNKDFVYEAEDGEIIEIKKGDSVWIPTVGFHRDPKYFENPSQFNPDRFNDENKANIPPFTYMPFGLGPRNCIASRFAQLEAKALLFYIINDFKLEASKKSTIPIELAKAGFQMVPVNGFWLKLTRRG